jgi:hypothetical protein
VRIAKAEWIADLNRALAGRRTDGVIVAVYGHTGNFMVASTLDLEPLRVVLREVLRTDCAVIHH